MVAAGVCFLPTLHTHSDETVHECQMVDDVDEPNLSGTFPAKTKDGTPVANAEAWFVYLELYVP